MNHCVNVTCPQCGEKYCVRCEGSPCPNCHAPYEKKTWQAPAITRAGTIDHQRLRFLDALLRMFGNTFTWQFVTTGDGRLNILMESDTRRASLSLCLDMEAPEEQRARDMKNIIRQIIFFA